MQEIVNSKLIRLVRELLEKGFTINGVTTLETGELAYELTGFYKSGTIRLYEDSNYIYALARYNQVTELSDTSPFESLVQLNYEWWNSSKDRYDGWVSPDPKWLPYLIQLGLVKEITNIVKTYE